MDYAKAFDKLPHKSLLYKMKIVDIYQNKSTGLNPFFKQNSDSTLIIHYIFKNTSNIKCQTGYSARTNTISNLHR